MENLIIAVAGNPLLFIGYVLSALAALGFVLFLAGIGGGAKHLFTYDQSAAHMEHARTRIFWGIYIMMVMLGVWQIIRVLIGEMPPATLLLSFFLLIPVWAPPLKHAIFGGGD